MHGQYSAVQVNGSPVVPKPPLAVESVSIDWATTGTCAATIKCCGLDEQVRGPLEFPRVHGGANTAPRFVTFGLVTSRTELLYRFGRFSAFKRYQAAD